MILSLRMLSFVPIVLLVLRLAESNGSEMEVEGSVFEWREGDVGNGEGMNE